jgi:regulatory protein
MTKLPKPEEADFRGVAIGLLARREHSQQELRSKLLSRGCDTDELDQLLHDLEAEGLQSDERYTESYIHSRIDRGFGPLRIQAELRQRGVSDALVEQFLDLRSSSWKQRAQAVWAKKYGEQAGDYKERARQARFLQGRGFSAHTISQILKNEWD